MHPVAAFAETALRQSVQPALRLRELLELTAQRMDHSLDATRLRAILEVYPERFRLLDPWCGRWQSPGAYRSGAATTDIDVWVVSVTEGAPPPSAPATLKLRQSVRWLARGVDPRSPTDVGRWYAIALSERATRRAVVRRAA
ncbi:MAG: hypothetical protein FJ207_13370 [Gemmatimonadetes bacterium]|nr:hypothetical protein [Gemmatimonadota bacterium]